MRTEIGSPWGVCRVTLYADGNAIDVALPDDVPVAALMPALRDIARRHGTSVHRLAVPGLGPLNAGLTLRENSIRDGAVLTTVAAAGPVYRPAVIDAAVEVAATCRTQPWLRRPIVARRMGLTAVAAMAGLLGTVLVPGEPGLADLLLAAAAVSVIAVASARVAADPVELPPGDGEDVEVRALPERRSRAELGAWRGEVRAIAVVAAGGIACGAACLALLCTTAALAATLCGLTLAHAGVLLTVAAVSLLTLTSRVVVRVHGLSPVAADARRLSNGLTGGAATGAALGVLAAGNAAPDWSHCAFAAAVAAVLVLRTRVHPEALPSTALTLAGITCCTAVLVVLQRHDPALTWLVGVLAASAGAGAAWLGAHPSAVTLSPVSARLLTALEHLLLVVVVPLACWSLDAFELVHRWAW